MIRRQFMQRVTAAAGATAALAVSGRAAKAEDASAVTFHLKGFTCITCAIGLEVVLRQQDGVVRAKASYDENTVTVRYEPDRTSAEALREFINKTTGFTVTLPEQG